MYPDASISLNTIEVCACMNDYIPPRTVWYNSLQCGVHYNDVIMGAIASQITNLTIVFSTVYWAADQRKHQSSVSLAYVRGNSAGTGEFPAQMASNAENVSIWWRHHDFDALIFSKNPHKSLPHSLPVRVRYGVSFACPNSWFIFCPSQCSDVCNIVLHWIIL